MPTVPYYAAMYLAVIQFLFASMWTIYVIFLPQLLTQAGIDSKWTTWLLLIDQCIFIVMDVALGFAADKVRRTMSGQLGVLMLGLSLISCLAFIALPWAAQLVGATGLLGLVFLWVITSSTLRVPPFVLLGQYAATPQMPLAVALQAIGLGIAGSIAPYLGTYLTKIQPQIPFVISSLVLCLTVIGLIYVERQLQQSSSSSIENKPTDFSFSKLMLIVASLFAGLAFQTYSALNMKLQLLQFAPKEELSNLLPIFWIGFNVLIFPISLLSKRMGIFLTLVIISFLTAMSAIFSVVATQLEWLLVAQFLTGGFWGGMFSVGITAALHFGKTGKEGLMLGLWFSMLSVAAFFRIGLVLSGHHELPEIKSLLGTIPIIFWILAAICLVIVWRTQKQETAS